MGMYVDSPPPAPEAQSYGESLGESYDAQLKYAQQLYDMESDPNHGRSAYAELDQQVIQQGLVGKDGTGRTGAVGLIAGQQSDNFLDGQGERKAGFNDDGSFAGTNQLDADLKFRQQSQSIKQTIGLAKDHGQGFTDAMRSTDMKSALSDYNAKAKESSNPDDIQRRDIVDSDGIGDRASFLAGGVDKIQYRDQAGNVNAGSQARNIGSQGQSNNIQGQQIGDLGGLRGAMNQQALQGLQDGGNLSDQDRRQVEQDARASATARGRGRSYSGVVDEVANMESLRMQRRAEGRAFAGQVAGQEAQLRSSDVGMDMQGQMANQQAQESMYGRSMQGQMANQQSDLQYGQRQLQASMSNQQARVSGAQLDQSAQVANQQRGLSNMSTMLAGYEKDADRQLQIDQINSNQGLATDQINRQLDMQALQADRASLAQRVGIEQSTSADPFMAITGRNFTGSQGGQNVYGNGAGMGASPALYNAGQGIEYMSNANANLANYQANVYGAKVGAQSAMFGAVVGAGASMASAGIKRGCWVAREVYGENNPMWLLFREWLFTESPSWFKATYLKYGERFAKFIKNKPKLKSIIRNWMTSKIKR